MRSKLDLELQAEGEVVLANLGEPLMTLEECAAKLGVSKSTVREDERRALGKIARILKRNREAYC